jgi:hypothetical protein
MLPGLAGDRSTAQADIVARLQREGQDAFTKHYSLGMWKLCEEAADEILKLRATITAAPGLLDALCGLLGVGPEHEGVRYSERVSRALDAIAKATGADPTNRDA